MNPIPCAQVEETLSDFLEKTLSPEAAEDFSGHLLTCGDCARLVAQVRSLTVAMQALEAVPEPPQLVRKIVAATAGSRDSGWRSWLSWPSVIWQPQFAMGAVTVAASFLILFHAAGPRARNLTLADLNPASVARVANRRAHLAYAHGVRFVSDLRVVYDIESRLAPPEPENAPARREQPAPSVDPHVAPRQKSKVVPRGSIGLEAQLQFANALEASLVPVDPNRSTP